MLNRWCEINFCISDCLAITNRNFCIYREQIARDPERKCAFLPRMVPSAHCACGVLSIASQRSSTLVPGKYSRNTFNLQICKFASFRCIWCSQLAKQRYPMLQQYWALNQFSQTKILLNPNSRKKESLKIKIIIYTQKRFITLYLKQRRAELFASIYFKHPEDFAVV